MIKIKVHSLLQSTALDSISHVEGLSNETRDPWGKMRRGASAVTSINRKDFGLTWNKALETGGVVVGDEVIINLEVEMIKE